MEIREETEGLEIEQSEFEEETEEPTPVKMNHVEKPRVDRRKILSEKKLESLRKARESKANKRRAKRKEKEDHERQIQQKLKKLEQMEQKQLEANHENRVPPSDQREGNLDRQDESQMTYEEHQQPLSMDEIQLINDEPQIEVKPVKRTRTRGQTKQVENTLNLVGFADPHLADEKLKEQEEFLKYQTQEMEDLRDAYEEMIQDEYDRKKRERELKAERERAVRRVRAERTPQRVHKAEPRSEPRYAEPQPSYYQRENSGLSSIFY